jgi:hypothetical protein
MYVIYGNTICIVHWLAKVLDHNFNDTNDYWLMNFNYYAKLKYVLLPGCIVFIIKNPF